MDDIAMQRALRAYQKQDYEKSMIVDKGVGAVNFESAGPPTWSQEAWDRFYAQYGFWPFSATELPKSFAQCPDWAYERMGLRRPPVTVVPG